jgi:two-component system, chemotaxis family, CheB/CheR fusion protein
MTSTFTELVPFSSDQEHLLQEVFTLLQQHTGHDFSNYKRPTLLRRIHRCMRFKDLPDLPSYIAHLQQHPSDIKVLLKSLLISVTQFFRDKQSFSELEQVVFLPLLQSNKRDKPVKIWVAGCATGEEAYSIAMLCAEYALHTADAPTFQIIATDIDEQALHYAKEGLYNATEVAYLSPERLQQFFTQGDEGYRVKQHLKDQVQFLHQNLLLTVPATGLNLISCRNVFIYLNYTAQEQALHKFRTVLQPGGYLFLGKAESINGAPHSFTTISREHQIYQS